MPWTGVPFQSFPPIAVEELEIAKELEFCHFRS